MNRYKRLFIIVAMPLALGISPAAALEVIQSATKKNTVAQQLLQAQAIDAEEKMDESEWVNELGADFSRAHISDLKTHWDEGRLFYYYSNEYGKFGAAINRLKKFNTSAKQYEIDLNPKINKWVNANISLAEASRSQSNFPARQYHLEAYFNALQDFVDVAVLKNMEFSLGHGAQLYKNLGNQKLYDYTVSVGYHVNDYFAWIRPTHYTPRGLNFYEVGITRYLSDHYNFVKASVGFGRFPAVGDILPLDQLVTATQQIGINLGGQFGLSKCLYLRWGVGYANIRYETNFHRYVRDAGIGLLWRF